MVISLLIYIYNRLEKTTDLSKTQICMITIFKRI